MSNYFSLEELTASFTASKFGIDNTPPKEVADKLQILISECLNKIREAYGKPIIVTSGYRCAELNKKVGGKPTSQHLRGEAVDIVGANNEETRKIFEVAKRLGMTNCSMSATAQARYGCTYLTRERATEGSA